MSQKRFPNGLPPRCTAPAEPLRFPKQSLSRSVDVMTGNSRQPAADVAARRRIVEEAVHSSEMEGLAVSSETLQDAEEYINGEIDAHELVTRTRARHGLD